MFVRIMVIDSAELIYISYYVGFATILRRVISRTYFIFVLQCFYFSCVDV